MTGVRWDGKFIRPGGLSDEDRAAVFRASDALQPGVTERDVKPDNVLETLFAPFASDELTHRTKLVAELRGVEPTPEIRAYVDAVCAERRRAGLGPWGLEVPVTWASLDGVVRPADLPPYRLRLDGAGQIRRLEWRIATWRMPAFTARRQCDRMA